MEKQLKNLAEKHGCEFFSINLMNRNSADTQKPVDCLISKAVKKYALSKVQEKATSSIEQTAEDKPGKRCLIS